jgi:hypothetical protein
MPNIGETIQLEIVGLGIIMYSRAAAAHIKQGEDYLSSHYWDEKDIQVHIQAGTIVGFGTASPGTFLLRTAMGYPSRERLDRAEHKLRLGVNVSGRSLCFRDLYDLMSWSPACPASQVLSIDDGIYHVTLVSDTPPSGVLGDEQLIEVYFAPLTAMPRLATEGVPTLVQ